MALEGNLKDFALSEILQLISVQQKSGYLNLKSTDDVAEIWFEKGRIRYATRSQYPINEQIKNYLIKTRKLTQDEIANIETAALQSNVSFDKVLVTGGYLTGQELTRIASFLVEEMIHHLFKWQAGSYSFDAGQKPPSSPANVSLKTEGILMEGMRRIDEWPGIEQKLPSPDIIVRSGEADPDEFSLIDDELKIIELAGSNGITLGDLSEVSGMGRYRTYETICNLMEVDLIQAVSYEKKEKTVEISSRINAGAILKPLGTFLGILILIVIGIGIIYGIRYGLNLVGFSGKKANLADEAKIVREVKNLQTALDIYLVQNYTYPQELADLYYVSLITVDELYDDVWGYYPDLDDSYKYMVYNNGLSYKLETSIGNFESK